MKPLRKESFGLIVMQLPEKYKENFDVSSEGPEVSSFGIFQVVVSLSIRSFLIICTGTNWHKQFKSISLAGKSAINSTVYQSYRCNK
jgi:hypothetical protein